MKIKKLTIKNLAVKHDYYASNYNFFSNDAGAHFETWRDFYEEYKDADTDMNLVYRWDISEHEDEDENPTGKYYMKIFIIGQRKGLYTPVRIEEVTDKDVLQICTYLKKSQEKLKQIWQPLSF